MSKRIVTAVAILGAAGVISGCSFEQPSAGCVVQDATDAPWQALYTLKSTNDDSKACSKLKGEALGVFKFVNPYPDLHPDVPKARLAIRPEGAAALTKYSYPYTVMEEGKEVKKTETVNRVDDPTVATSLSATLSDEPQNELCQASSFNAARVEARAVFNEHVTPSEQLVPAETVSYAFDNVSVYSNPSAPGTQLHGTLTYSDGTGCEAVYEVNAFWPQTGCDPASKESSETCGDGSGINPDFAVRCEPALANTIVRGKDANGNVIMWPGACVLSKKVPSLNQDGE